MKLGGLGYLALAHYLLVHSSPGISQAAAPSPKIIVTLTDGSQVIGTLLSQSASQVDISASSFFASGVPPTQLLMDSVNISSCSMADLGVSPISIAGHLCTAAVPPIRSGLQQASFSVGYVGSAQRDASAKGTITFAGFQSLKTDGAFRGKTYFNASAAYDNKWKSTPLSSNVTQVYDGILQQSIFSTRTPISKCSSDDYPLAYQLIGHAYHNNGQGIRIDQSYGFGLAKLFVMGKPAGPESPGCKRTPSLYAQRVELSADVRSVNYILYSPGNNAHGVGTQLQIGYSRTFPSKQVIAITIGGVPVYNDINMSQASGVFEYVIPFKSTWSFQLSVTNNYYQIAPKTFNKNYLNVAVGLKFTPAKTGSSK